MYKGISTGNTSSLRGKEKGESKGVIPFLLFPFSFLLLFAMGEGEVSKKRALRLSHNARRPSIYGADGGNRTHTEFELHWILSPARLPVPPLGPLNRVNCNKSAFFVKSRDTHN